MAAPKDFTFSVKYQVGSKFFFDIAKVYDIQDNIFGSYTSSSVDTLYMLQACPKNGYHQFGNITTWVVNREKNNSMYLYFKCKQDWIYLNNTINLALTKEQEKNPFEIYKYVPLSNMWTLETKYVFRGENDLIGLTDCLRLFDKDLNNIKKYTSFLESIGESKSNNYLLYGPPGTGKTTLIKTLASKYEIPIFIVNPNSLNLNNIDNILNPERLSCNNKCRFKLVLFEDFDRFFSDNNANSAISSILNSLDGLQNTSGIIRFFTANDPTVIFNIPALINRMSAKIKFFMPNKEIFEGKLKRLLSYYDSYDVDKFNKFIDLVVKKNITVRPFTNYIIRYMFDDNYQDSLIENIDQLN